MHEGQHRGDRRLVARGAQILDWMWTRAGSAKQGERLDFTDLRGLPVQELPRHEVLVAASQGDHRDLTGMETHGRSALRRNARARAPVKLHSFP
jgi:hypothetical protein